MLVAEPCADSPDENYMTKFWIKTQYDWQEKKILTHIFHCFVADEQLIVEK